MNQNQALKVAIACGLGGLIGAVAALEMASAFEMGKYFAFVGMLLGGVVSYLAYEFKAVISAFGRAWRSLSGWRLNWSEIGAYLATVFMAAVVMWTGLLVMFSIVLVVKSHTRPHTAIIEFEDVLLFLFFGLASALSSIHALKKQGEDAREYLQDWEVYAFHVNPIAFAIYPFIGAWWCLRRIPRALIALYRGAIFLGRVAWRAFRYVHSDVRVLCFVDGTLGATAGYLYGHPSVGLLAGISFGLVNYIVVRRLVFRTTEVRV